MNESRVTGVVIDAGHGGNDPGAVNGNIREKDFTLQVSQYMFNRFNELGVPVTLTRDSDESLPRNERVSRILNAYGNNPSVVVISNHINAGGGEGAEVVYALRNNSSLAREVLENIGAAGQKTRKYYQRRLPEDPSKDYYFIHRLTGKTEPLLVEYGFIDNRNDLNKLQNNLLDYGEGVVKAVTEYLGYNYVAPNESIGDNKIYTVKKGDTLYSISKRLGVDVNELIKFNNLSSNTLSIGQVLNIPSDNGENIDVDYLTYVVKPGDTLYGIGNKYNVKVDDIINFNNLSSTLLSVGQNILIPGVSSGGNINNEGQYYLVQAGDNLYSIARKFNVSVDDIMLANDLNSTLLVVGQQLYIPTGSVIENSNEPLTYTVVKGDSLYSIANKFNTSVNKIKELNNLDSNILSIGQVLNIPV